MKCLKNPRRDPRLINTVKHYEQACTINVVLIANLLDALHDLYRGSFGRTGMERYLNAFIDNVHWLEADDDSEVREHRMNAILAEMPYVTKENARDILRKVSLQLSAKACEVLAVPAYEDGLIENTVLMLSTLYDDFGFRRKRICDVMARWVEGGITDGDKWLAEHMDFRSDRRDIVDKLLKAKKKAPRTTLREQIEARRGLEALKAYQDDVRGCES